MNTAEIAQRLVDHCRKAHWEAAQTELYADDAVSIEPCAGEISGKETRGRDAIIEKGRKFDGMIETLHAIEVSDPIVATNSFACIMRIDVTMKGQGRMDMKELCVYEVASGKIVKEEFHV